jgi:hypothetical protein
MELLLALGFLGVGAESLEYARLREKLLPRYVEMFESRGVEYTKGYLAALQGRKPLWLLRLFNKIRLAQGVFVSEEAAQTMLRNHRIDPLMCGQELWKN